MVAGDHNTAEKSCRVTPFEYQTGRRMLLTARATSATVGMGVAVQSSIRPRCGE